MNPIVSKNCRIRNPENFKVGKYSIVDDFSYFSTKIKIGKCSHIASGCSIAGGSKFQFSLEDYCSVSSGVKIWCSSNDFVNDLVIIKPENTKLADKPIQGDVIIGNYCAVGANTVIMPNNKIPEGVSIGALSFVPQNFKWKPWTVYAGVPIKPIKARNKKRILEQIKEMERQLKN